MRSRKVGESLVKALNLKLNKEGRVTTEWGTKTPVGLFRTMVSQIEEIEGEHQPITLEVTPVHP